MITSVTGRANKFIFFLSVHLQVSGPMYDNQVFKHEEYSPPYSVTQQIPSHSSINQYYISTPGIPANPRQTKGTGIFDLTKVVTWQISIWKYVLHIHRIINLFLFHILNPHILI